MKKKQSVTKEYTYNNEIVTARQVVAFAEYVGDDTAMEGDWAVSFPDGTTDVFRDDYFHEQFKEIEK